MIVLRRSFVKGLGDKLCHEINEEINQFVESLPREDNYYRMAISAQVRLIEDQLVLETSFLREYKVLFYMMVSFIFLVVIANILFFIGGKGAFSAANDQDFAVGVLITIYCVALFATIGSFLGRDLHRKVEQFLETLGATVE